METLHPTLEEFQHRKGSGWILVDGFGNSSALALLSGIGNCHQKIPPGAYHAFHSQMFGSVPGNPPFTATWREAFAERRSQS